MRPIAALCLAPLLFVACQSDSHDPPYPLDAAVPSDFGPSLDARDVAAVDVPLVALDVPADAGFDAPPLNYVALPDLSPTPVRHFTGAPTAMLLDGRDYRARLVTDAGTITIDLLEAETPITVNSFVFLARNHFFDGIAFHRVIEGFVAQGGDPNTVDGGRATWGRGGPGYGFGLEVSDDLHFDGPGVVGMARADDPNTNGSQFYITLAATPNLDGQYTVFGRVVGDEGLAVLDHIARGEPPATPTRITTVVILAAAR